MAMTMKVDAGQFVKNAESLRAAMREHGPQLIAGESKLLAAQAMVLQQPYGKGTRQKKMIEGSAERGLRRTVKPVFASGKGNGKNEWHAPDLQKPIRTKKYAAVQEAFRKMGGRMTGATVVPFDKETHKLNRWKNKLSKEQYRVYTLDTAAWKRRLRELQKRAGYIKASWAKAYGKLGGHRTPTWIRRHVGYAKGFADTDKLHSSNPSVTFGGISKVDAETRASFQEAINRRAKIMARKLRLLAKGYSTAWKNGSLAVFKPKIPVESEP
jgi:hypothetical protein